jgi:hypothetical protein
MTTLRIDVADRGAALDLARRLSRFRTHLVQLGRNRWYVGVKADCDSDALVLGVLDVAADWVDEQSCEARLRLGEREYVLRPRVGHDAA